MVCLTLTIHKLPVNYSSQNSRDVTIYTPSVIQKMTLQTAAVTHELTNSEEE